MNFYLIKTLLKVLIRVCTYKRNIELAHDKVLPISREKFLDMQKIMEFIPKTSNSKFYDTLYSIDNISCAKSQKLLHKLFDKCNKINKYKSRSAKKQKTK